MGREQPRAAELCRSCLPSGWCPGFQKTTTAGLRCGCMSRKENQLSWCPFCNCSPACSALQILNRGDRKKLYFLCNLIHFSQLLSSAWCSLELSLRLGCDFHGGLKRRTVKGKTKRGREELNQGTGRAGRESWQAQQGDMRDNMKQVSLKESVEQNTLSPPPPSSGARREQRQK